LKHPSDYPWVHLENFLSVLIVAIVFVNGVAIGTEPVIRTIAGTGAIENNGNGGDAAEINVSNPFGVEFGPDGGLYICEVGNHRLLRLDLKTQKITTIAGIGKPGFSGDGGLATAAMLNEPYEVRFAKNGDIYFVEMKNHLVRKIDAKSGVISTVAGDGQQGFQGDGGPATAARFSRPHSIALDNRGGLFIADIGNHRIRRVDLKTGVIETVAGNGESKLPRDGETAKGNPVIGPRALFFHEGNLWVALREGHSLWRIDLSDAADSVWKHVAGVGTKGYSGDGEAAAKATFNGPKGVAIGPNGNIYIVDTENQAIRRIDREGVIHTIAGNGKKGGAGDNGPANKAELARPHGVCVSADGEVVIGDSLNHRVRVVSPVSE